MTRRLDLDQLLADAADDGLSDADIARRLRGVDLADARTRLLDRLAVAELDEGDAVALGRTLQAADPASVLDRALDIIADRAVDESARLACFQAVMSVSPERIANAVRGDPRRQAGLEFAQVYSTLLAGHEHAEAIDTLHAMARQVPAKHLATWATFVERLRERAGLPASIAYAALLRDAALVMDDGARAQWLDAVVAEADPAGERLLDKLRAGAPKKLRAPFQAALLKLKTARVGGGKGAADKVRVWCSQPDGQGAVAALVAIATPDGRNTLVNLCFRLTRDLRQGFVEPRADERTILEMIEQLTEGSVEVTRAPPGEFAALVDEAVASHRRMKVPVPRECEAPLRALESLPRSPLPAAPAPAAVDAARVRALLSEPRHEYWYFDDADLLAVGALDMTDRAAVLKALGRSAMPARVEAMARFMVHWWRWRGEPARAAEWVAVADEVARDFAGSALAQGMADASSFAAREPMGAASDGYGVEGILIPLAELFPDVALAETKVIRFEGHGSIPDGDYRFEETYCTARDCNCERVTFVVTSGALRGVRIGHAFTKAAAKRFYGEQTELDPLGANPPWAGALARELDARMKGDAAWRASLRRHYELMRSL